MKAPEGITKNIFAMTPDELKADGIDSLPGSLAEALDAYEADPFIKEALGEHVYEKYLEGKRKEWDDYRTKVSQWEIGEYLTKY